MSGTYTASTTMSTTGNAIVDGVLSGYLWNTSSITYAFPTLTTDYVYTAETASGFSGANAAQQAMALYVMEQSYGTSANDGFSVEGFTNLSLSLGSATQSTIRLANSDRPDTAYTYFPGALAGSGDVWFGTHFDYTHPTISNYGGDTTIHEIGHALGLKHTQDSSNLTGFPVELAAYDALEYSVMSYRNFVGDNTNGYSPDNDSGPQTFMMVDILGLQTMYGADYTTNSGNTTYTWSMTDGDTRVNGSVGVDANGTKIFATIWDGGGTDTYDLSNFTTNLNLDLSAGGFSDFGNGQLAHLKTTHYAQGNIYNAFTFGGSQASLIENAIGGGGADTIRGNSIGNTLTGNGGQDNLNGGQGNDFLFGGNAIDTLEGGAGNDSLTGDAAADIFVFHAVNGIDIITDFQDGTDHFSLQSTGYTSWAQVSSHVSSIGGHLKIQWANGDTVEITGLTTLTLDASDFSLFS